jgi:hypothetical protein
MTRRYPSKQDVREQTDDRFAAELWGSDTLADYLGVHRLTPVIWRRENRGPPFIDASDARFIRYLRKDIWAWLEHNRRNGWPENDEGRTTSTRGKAITYDQIEN